MFCKTPRDFQEQHKQIRTMARVIDATASTGTQHLTHIDLVFIVSHESSMLKRMRNRVAAQCTIAHPKIVTSLEVGYSDPVPIQPKSETEIIEFHWNRPPGRRLKLCCPSMNDRNPILFIYSH